MSTQPIQSTIASGLKTSQETISETVAGLVRANPDRDVNYLETLNQLSANKDVNLHKVTAALLQMERKGFLVEHRREKVDRPEAKDRKVIQYKATRHFKQALGIIPV